MSRRDGLWLLGRLFLGAVFVYAGFSKVVEPVENFRGVIAEYQVFPYEWIGVLAASIPWLELIFGIFLMLGFLTRASALVLALFSFGFILLMAMSYLKLGSLPESCGCFGEGGIHLTVPQVILLDLLDTLVGIGLFLNRSHPLSVDHGLLSKT